MHPLFVIGGRKNYSNMKSNNRQKKVCNHNGLFRDIKDLVRFFDEYYYAFEIGACRQNATSMPKKKTLIFAFFSLLQCFYLSRKIRK